MTYNQYTWNSPSIITLPGGTRKEVAYTPLMQPKTISVKDSAQNPLMTYDYGYSPAGNIITKNTEGGNYTYQYDPLYRLTNVANPGNTEAYTYDGVGNRLTSADVSGNWNYNNNNELSSYNSVSYEYDLNGNTTKKTVGSVVTNFVYDIDNHLVQITRNSQPVTYYYDPFSRRLWKEVGGSRKHFLYTDEGLTGEYDGIGGEIKTYGYAPNSTWSTNPLFQKIGSAYYWYQNDHLGTPQKMTDSSGAVVWAASYDAFGKATVTVNAVENNLRFPGQYYDAETGDHYNGHRYYDPKTGRYVTADPIGLEGGVNLFIYAGQNPLLSTDVLGLFDDGTKYGTSQTKWPGHSDFKCTEGFDFTKEDHGGTHPYIEPSRHFRNLPDVEKDLRDDVTACNDKDMFERHMHQGQDYFSHRKQGYDTPLKHIKAGHWPDDTDNNPRAKELWQEADTWTCKWTNEWKKRCPCVKR